METASHTTSPFYSIFLSKLETECPQCKDFEHVAASIMDLVEQYNILPGGVHYFEGKEWGCKDIIITDHDVHIIQERAGKGTYSEAFFTNSIQTSGGQCTQQLVKFSKKPFDREVKFLDLLSPKSKKSRHIDHFIGHAKVSNKPDQYIGFFQPSQCDLKRVDYSNMKNPASFILGQLMGMLRGMASFHRQNIVLCDVKGSNFLVNPEEEGGKVTDWGLLRQLVFPLKMHETAVTPEYAAPYIWDNILGQKYRTSQHLLGGGYQGKAADLFAFGRTIQSDVLKAIFSELGKRHSIDLESLITCYFVPKKIEQTFSNQDLLNIESSHPGRVFHRGVTSEGKDVLLVFEDRQKVFDAIRAHLKFFEGLVDQEELQCIEALAELSMELQNPSKEGLLKFLDYQEENQEDLLVAAVLERLEAIKRQTATVVQKLDFSQSADCKRKAEGAILSGAVKKQRIEEVNQHIPSTQPYVSPAVEEAGHPSQGAV